MTGPVNEHTLRQYRHATNRWQEAQEAADRIAAERAALLAQMNTDGASMREIAAAIHVSTPRVQQLIAKHRAAARQAPGTEE